MLDWELGSGTSTKRHIPTTNTSFEEEVARTDHPMDQNVFALFWGLFVAASCVGRLSVIVILTGHTHSVFGH